MNRILLAVALVIAVAPVAAEAQRTPRRQQTIEIRGQVPTPQVVTVRPREVPNYDRRVLVPTFYDHDFWQSILPGYLLVREHMITGAVPGDTTTRRDTTARTMPTVTPPPGAGAPPPGSGTGAGTPIPPGGAPPPVRDLPVAVPPAGPALPPR
jgi:hypothetical protein